MQGINEKQKKIEKTGGSLPCVLDMAHGKGGLCHAG
jgi:hypothetical protein